MPSRTPSWTVAIAVLLAPLLATAAPAGDFAFQNTFGGNFFSVSPPCPVKQLPTFESLVPVPGFVDPFEQDLIPFFCSVDVFSEGKGVKKAKGKYEVDLVVRDNNTGELESFPVKSGRFKTNRDGEAQFDFDLPAELFADGFESGDVSAWSYTRTDFTNRKRTDSVVQDCQAGSSKSD